MPPTARFVLFALILAALSACSSRHFGPPDMQGPAALVDDAGTPRLWVLTKQEETNEVGVGGGSTSDWRTDTFFHFAVQAFDPATARPLWSRRLLTLGDPDADGPEPSRVIGSAVDARLLGQDGALVWLLIGTAPYAVDAATGKIVADADALQQRNPQLRGLLPSDAQHYGFDHGLVLLAADARRFVVRGPALQASAYTPPEPVAVDLRPPPGRLVVPSRPIGEVPTRQATVGGAWLGLYSEKEAADAADDEFGDNYLYPYTIADEGALARRTFWRASIADAQRFDEHFKRLANLAPVPGAPTFLKGRFLTDPATGDARLPDDPAGVLVWHSTRIDSAGRLALTRLDPRLSRLWTAELPLSETGTINPVVTWFVPGATAGPDRLLAMGLEQSEVDGVTRRVPHLVSIDLRTGAWQGWDMEREAALP